MRELERGEVEDRDVEQRPEEGELLGGVEGLEPAAPERAEAGAPGGQEERRPGQEGPEERVEEEEVILVGRRPVTPGEPLRALAEQDEPDPGDAGPPADDLLGVKVVLEVVGDQHRRERQREGGDAGEELPRGEEPQPAAAPQVEHQAQPGERRRHHPLGPHGQADADGAEDQGGERARVRPADELPEAERGEPGEERLHPHVVIGEEDVLRGDEEEGRELPGPPAVQPRPEPPRLPPPDAPCGTVSACSAVEEVVTSNPPYCE